MSKRGRNFSDSLSYLKTTSYSSEDEKKPHALVLYLQTVFQASDRVHVQSMINKSDYAEYEEIENMTKTVVERSKIDVLGLGLAKKWYSLERMQKEYSQLCLAAGILLTPWLNLINKILLQNKRQKSSSEESRYQSHWHLYVEIEILISSEGNQFSVSELGKKIGILKSKLPSGYQFLISLYQEERAINIEKIKKFKTEDAKFFPTLFSFDEDISHLNNQELEEYLVQKRNRLPLLKKWFSFKDQNEEDFPELFEEKENIDQYDNHHFQLYINEKEEQSKIIRELKPLKNSHPHLFQGLNINTANSQQLRELLQQKQTRIKNENALKKLIESNLQYLKFEGLTLLTDEQVAELLKETKERLLVEQNLEKLKNLHPDLFEDPNTRDLTNEAAKALFKSKSNEVFVKKLAEIRKKHSNHPILIELVIKTEIDKKENELSSKLLEFETRTATDEDDQFLEIEKILTNLAKQQELYDEKIITSKMVIAVQQAALTFDSVKTQQAFSVITQACHQEYKLIESLEQDENKLRLKLTRLNEQAAALEKSQNQLSDISKQIRPLIQPRNQDEKHIEEKTSKIAEFKTAILALEALPPSLIPLQEAIQSHQSSEITHERPITVRVKSNINESTNTLKTKIGTLVKQEETIGKSLKSEMDSHIQQLSTAILAKQIELKKQLHEADQKVQNQENMLRSTGEAYNAAFKKMQVIDSNLCADCKLFEIKLSPSPANDLAHLATMPKKEDSFDQQLETLHSQVNALKDYEKEVTEKTQALVGKSQQIIKQNEFLQAKLQVLSSNLDSRIMQFPNKTQNQLKTIKVELENLITTAKQQLKACNTLWGSQDLTVIAAAESESKALNFDDIPLAMRAESKIIQSATTQKFWETNNNFKKRNVHGTRLYFLLCLQQVVTLSEQKEITPAKNATGYIAKAVKLIQLILDADNQLRRHYGFSEINDNTLTEAHPVLALGCLCKIFKPRETRGKSAINASQPELEALRQCGQTLQTAQTNYKSLEEIKSSLTPKLGSS